MMDERLKLADDFLRYAWEEFTLLRQACEKGWGCVAQALKIVNPNIRRHLEFGRTAAELAEKYNNEEVVHGEMCGELPHRQGFYEGDLDEKIIEHGLRCVQDFLILINGILNGKHIVGS